MKLVIDTNIVVSSFLSPKGVRAKVLQSWQNGQFELIVSEDILSEYEKALNYKEVSSRHDLDREEIAQIIKDWQSFATIVEPKQKLFIITEDPEDNKFLECAIESGAEYIISADRHLLDLEKYQGIQILSPSEFLSPIKD